jgi:hypothetical protein
MANAYTLVMATIATKYFIKELRSSRENWGCFDQSNEEPADGD